MAKVVTCARGHFYDGDRFDTCPHCLKAGALPPPINGSVKTEAFFKDNKSAAPAGAGARSTPPPVKNPGSIQIDIDERKTEAWLNGKKINPVAGWLVCIEGENKGRSYEVHVNKNQVGRSPANEIRINDMHISNDKHFSVTYDPLHNKFYVSEGKGIVHRNGELVQGSNILEEGDLLSAGVSKYVFVPFCREGRDWND